MTETITPCNYSISDVGGNRKLFIDCEECADDFSIDKCLPGIILALEENYNIDSIVLSDFIEIQYSDENLNFLKDLKYISEELDRLSSRRPDRDGCEDCEIEPRTMYPSLKEGLLTEHEDFYQRLFDYTLKVMKIEGCKGCRKSAKEELTVLGEKVLEFRSKVLLKAYGVLR